jgi:hypothetical protein
MNIAAQRRKTESACPEKRLLLLLSRTRVNEVLSVQIDTLLRSPIDWNFLFEEASGNMVTTLIRASLARAGSKSVPAGIVERLDAQARENTAKSLLLTAELIRVTDLFESAGILAVPYKGPVLASQAYGEIASREYDDIDIILPERELPKAHDRLVSAGYLARFPWLESSKSRGAMIPAEYVYFHPARNSLVELHTERTLRHFPRTPDIDRLAQSLVPVSISGRQVRTFRPEITLVLLCIHGSKHFWERLSWIVDISEFVQANSALEWEGVWSCAESLGASRMVDVGLGVANRLLDLPLPDEIGKLLKSRSEAEEIIEELSSGHLRRENSQQNALARFRMRMRMLESPTDGLRYAFKLAALPAEEDWAAFRLPRMLSPFYAVLRPFRLLRKYGMRNQRPRTQP